MQVVNSQAGCYQGLRFNPTTNPLLARGADFLSLPLTRVDFPVSGENVCEADKRGLGVDSPQGEDGGRDNYPSVKNQRFLPAPLTRGALGAPAPVQLFVKLEFVEHSYFDMTKGLMY